MDLVRGEPLEDLQDWDRARGERARLLTVASRARLGRVEAALAVGNLGRATADLEGLVAADPLNETWWARLMTALYRQGRQADALRAYQEVRRVLAEELGLEPGPELQAIERQVLSQDQALLNPDPTAGVPHQLHRQRAALPSRLTSLIGREDLLETLAEDLQRGRLVTTLGPGGVGKTTLAVELARRHIDRATVLVELAAIGEADAVIAAVADALGLAAVGPSVTTAATSTVARIIDTLNSTPTMVVLDNCEHVLDTAAKLAHQLLEACPYLVIVATSREILNVPGEIIRPVPPLPEDHAVALFLDRAAAVAQDLPLQDHLGAVAQICTHLDGLPLAIELAAAKLRSLHPTELLHRLDDRFGVLSGGARTAQPRQQTLRGLIDWSHDLLEDPERIVLRRLAAFHGGATLAAAEIVCSDTEVVSSGEVAGIIERLIDKSLLLVERNYGHARYSMLQTIAEYAREQLLHSGERETVARRHAQELAARLAPATAGLLGPTQREWMAIIATERDNSRAALDMAVNLGDAQLALQLAAPLGWYFYMAAQTESGTSTLAAALACPGPSEPALRAHVLAHHGWLAANGPQIEVALASTIDAVNLLGSVNDPSVATMVLGSHMMVLLFSGRTSEAREVFTRAEEAAQQSGDSWERGMVALLRGEIAQVEGDTEQAAASFADASARFEALGDEFALAIALNEAAETAEVLGDYDKAGSLLSRAIDIAHQAGFSGTPLAMRARLGNVETLRGNLDRAESLHRQLLEDLGTEPLPWVRAIAWVGLATVARRTDRPGDAETWLAAAWEETRTREVPTMRALVLSARGYTADQLGDHRVALGYQLDGLATAAAYPAPRVVANALEGVAGALAAADPPDQPTEPARQLHELAARLLGAGDGLRRRTGGPMPPGERFDVDRAEQRICRALSRQRFEDLFARGATEPVEDLISQVRALFPDATRAGGSAPAQPLLSVPSGSGQGPPR
ncbi:MAG: ATP-binding protein [Acidimicrobiales bacterium]